jgi:hypothetical protein
MRTCWKTILLPQSAVKWLYKPKLAYGYSLLASLICGEVIVCQRCGKETAWKNKVPTWEGEAGQSAKVVEPRKFQVELCGPQRGMDMTRSCFPRSNPDGQRGPFGPREEREVITYICKFQFLTDLSDHLAHGLEQGTYNALNLFQFLTDLSDHLACLPLSIAARAALSKAFREAHFVMFFFASKNSRLGGIFGSCGF